MVSCLYVLTRRLGTVPAAIRQFLEQDETDSELILIDDVGVAGLVSAPETERIRLLQLPRGMSYDEKLRYAGENAAGDVLCEWAAGVFHSAGRLRAQKKGTRKASVLDTAPGTRMWRKGAFDAKPKVIGGAELFRAGEVAREGGPPMVSCVLPTRNRRWAVPLALRWFLAQDYPAKELIVVDDGELAVEDLVRGHEEVRYVRVNGRMTVGAKRNLGCQHARGEYVAHWDDDDWVAPWRLSYQVGELEATGAELCGVEQMLYWDPLGGRAYRYVYPANEKRWVAGGSFVYRHSTWERLPFPDVNVGEDNAFVWGLPEASVLPLADFDFYVALLHAGNTSLKLIEPTRWAPADAQGILRMLGADARRYVEALRELEGPRPAAAPRDSYLPPEAPLRPGASKEPPRFPDVSVEPFTVATEEHLRLPEFASLNAVAEVGGGLRWEIPFAMYQSRLSDEMRVLDCSAELTGLGEAIAELYPRVAYAHWPPVTAPRNEGGPVYDGVFCLSTLEKLAPEGREELMGAMAALLRPGGRMVCTVDLRAGFGAEELAELASRHGMAALGEAPRGRGEGMVGAVFTRGPEAPFGGKKVVLGLLSWNTRTITLEALDALATEARTLERLGHRAGICVVDNGSTDGAGEALRERARGLGIEQRVILNTENVGNSRGRNQMIDAALEMGADYLFFCDGDIEPVPFSTFVMLRYMEAAGDRLGCFGAWSFQCTPDRERTTEFLFSLAGCRLETSDVLAWTQYGLFRCEMFRRGARFEESGPFGEPGHGLEDVDFAFQMNALGYGNHYFSGMWYLHRNLSSSVGILREQGVNPTAAYYARRDYLVRKWERNPAAGSALGWLRRARPPWPGEEGDARRTLQLTPRGPEVEAPAGAAGLAEAAASDMLDRVELEAIGYCLATMPGDGIVVEIGAYIGRTTVFMAQILRLLGRGATKIVSIDPFERCTPDNFNPQGSYARYMKNLRDAGVDRQCMALAAFSEDAAPVVPGNVALLVIDGWHYYDAVKADLELYLPKVVAGGIVFIDDYGPAYPDVVRAVDEFLAGDEAFEVLAKEYYVVLRRR